MLGIEFNGEYEKGFVVPGEDADTDLISFMDSIANVDLKTRAGKKYSGITDCMETYWDEDTLDPAGYKIHSGGINGLGTLYEAKILTKGHVYYCSLVVNDTIFLYTNDHIYLADKEKTPVTIGKWMPKMKHSAIVIRY